MFLDSTDANEVCHVINTLKLSNCKGIDGISSGIVKSVVVNIAIPLTSIFNKSLELAKFPDKLKIAQIYPIYKSDDKLLANNYRPISILPTFSKNFERLMYNRLLDFLNKHDVFAQNQYGFRENIVLFWLL